MKISSKFFIHFIYYILDRLIFYIPISSYKKKFVFLFNLCSFFYRSKNRIFLKDNFYYNEEIDWRFYHKKQGLYAYGRGFKKRIEDLKSSYLIKDLEFNDDDIIIDVGANNGDFYLCFDKKIKYYAYEPSPIVFSNLQHNVKNQNLFNKGIWKSDSKKIEFYLSDEFGDSSILPIKNYTEKILIHTTTLDDIIENIQKPIKLLKLEAEGSEPEILYGLKKYMNLINYITIDCGFERGIEQKSTVSECFDYLIKNNFTMINSGGKRIVFLYKNNNIGQ